MIKCPNCERKWFENTKAAEVIEESNKCIVCCTETDEEWLQSCVTVTIEIEPGLIDIFKGDEYEKCT